VFQHDMTTEELIALLASHATVGKAPRKELEWIAVHGRVREFNQGEIVSRPGEIVDALYIIITGHMSIYVRRENGLRKTMEWGDGEVTGLLPYSRLTTPPGETIIEEPTLAVAITRADLPEMIRQCYEITAALVHVMTDRARRFTSTDLRDEKMISLGKLAAGFAHEVNNPASAALRDAKTLVTTLSHAEEAARVLYASNLTPPQLATLDQFWLVCTTSSPSPTLTGLALADREDEITEWLEGHGMEEDLAAELARTPASIADMEKLSLTLEGKCLEAVLRWIGAAFAARMLVTNIERAAGRIHTLVSAAKGFTHMDRSPDVEAVEISTGLTDTVVLLGGKAKGKSVEISLDVSPDLPPIRGFAAEINQVWMNLIDNAIDAAPEHGHVHVSGVLEGPQVIVTVTDDGPGVPPEIQKSIFDPFFTTKPVGEGTGLGLDIVRRVVNWHNGEVTLTSRPGITEFRVALPLAGAG
jgi:signal transduction histidine kinase